MSASFWLEPGPREGFSERCSLRFGMSFDGGRIANFVPPQLPEGRKARHAFPSVREAVEIQKKGRSRGGRGANTCISQRAVNRERLVG